MKKSFLSIYMLISISLLSCDVSRLNQRNIDELKIFVEKAKYYSIKLDAIYNECTGAYNDIMTYSEGTFSDQSKVNQAISILKKDNKIVNKFKELEKIIEEYKPMFLSKLIDDFAIELDQAVDNDVSNARHVADSYKKLRKSVVLAYIESFDVISSKFVDSKFVEASKKFVNKAKEFVEENDLIALECIVKTIGDMVNDREINSRSRYDNFYKKEADFLGAAVELEGAYKAIKQTLL
ncbi:factor H-binding protein CspZ [Borreliella burgdorferi]|uniref:Complement regulator-acquiring surface protein 2 n=1 Tax=Borreliella burgdorferi 118a TaxID=476210 RepID=A0A7U3YBQ7_BORBG|nr:factor H-binding protein CspZ [Borreliella burgdorferi]ACN93075.1 complement regulator-acquiring surface protein 2 [Borreliella burgdorferi 118a]MCD2386075.1 factor H-binding protein CspZ [Borreliella burgdorferi]PRQ97578.1 cell surface protein [Borreliella burgdorferi]PRR33092.1 cell surface protein [Borreliella burgdorferi]PRR35691.1 cell surface protein [Borreliella burgdorferi]